MNQKIPILVGLAAVAAIGITQIVTSLHKPGTKLYNGEHACEAGQPGPPYCAIYDGQKWQVYQGPCPDTVKPTPRNKAKVTQCKNADCFQIKHLDPTSSIKNVRGSLKIHGNKNCLPQLEAGDHSSISDVQIDGYDCQ